MGLFPKDRNLAVPLERLELEVRASDYGLTKRELEVRLDAFLTRRLQWRSRTSIQGLIREGRVLVGHLAPDRPGVREPRVERRVGRLLRHGDLVVVEIPPELRLSATHADPGELEILFEDELSMAVHKPAGMAVHPSGKHQAGTLIQRVHALYRSDDGDGAETAAPPIRLCHRLDLETSGIVLLGKGELAHRELQQAFEGRRVEKEYLAICHGEPAQDEGVIELPIGPALASRVRLKMTIQEGGLPSRTEWRVLQRGGGRSLLSCRPRTGRQHQIRVHLEAIGHPLLGDKLYGVEEGLFLRSLRGELTEDDQRALGHDRHALHHHRLGWSCPRTGEAREAVCPLPEDLRGCLPPG